MEKKHLSDHKQNHKSRNPSWIMHIYSHNILFFFIFLGGGVNRRCWADAHTRTIKLSQMTSPGQRPKKQQFLPAGERERGSNGRVSASEISASDLQKGPMWKHSCARWQGGEELLRVWPVSNFCICTPPITAPTSPFKSGLTDWDDIHTAGQSGPKVTHYWFVVFFFFDSLH